MSREEVFRATGPASATRMFIRIGCTKDGKLTGASLCAPDAGHLAHIFALAIGRGLTATDLLNMPYYHPTLEEGLKSALRTLCKETGQDQPNTREDDAVRGL